MTPKQSAFIASLADQRDLPDAERAILKSLDADAVSTREASVLIDALLKRPARAQAKADVTPLAPVAQGRYAVTLDGVLKFFKVDRPTQGKWAGRLFLSEQAGDNFFPVRDARKWAILSAIHADADALARYGRELGVCGICGRTLTDDESRAKGIGPVCDGRRAA